MKRPITTVLTLPPEQHRQAVDAAFETGITLSTFIRSAVAEKLQRSEWLDDVLTTQTTDQSKPL